MSYVYQQKISLYNTLKISTKHFYDYDQRNPVVSANYSLRPKIYVDLTNQRQATD
jgi:hypothetical protein